MGNWDPALDWTDDPTTAAGQLVLHAREQGSNHIVVRQVNLLQRMLLVDGRLRQRLEEHVLILEGAHIANVGHVAILLADTKRGRQVAIDLMPEAQQAWMAGPERSRGFRASRELEAVLQFRGSDVFHNVDDVVAIIARYEHDMFSSEGFEQALSSANPSTRRWRLNRWGVTWVRVPWVRDDGEEVSRGVHARRILRPMHRR